MSTSKSNSWELDAIDALILQDGLRIQSLYFSKELNLMLIVLNNRKVLQRDLSDFARLYNAQEEDLNRFELGLTGVHWPTLDEDLSLRGFLQYEMLIALGGNKAVA
jgi:hypothetical protein